MKPAKNPSLKKIAKYFPNHDAELMKRVIDDPSLAWDYVKYHELYPPLLEDYTPEIIRLVALKYITNSLAVEFFVSNRGLNYIQLNIRHPLPTFIQYEHMSNISLVRPPYLIDGKKNRSECVRCI